MIDFLSRLFDTADFPPRWRCGNWTEAHGWLHILSDLGIWSAYFAIPIILLTFARRRPDIPFRMVFLLFGSFILACGTTHLLEAVIFWKPIYRFAGLVKLATAVISWSTIAVLIKVIPEALALRSPAMLEREVARRTSELKQSNADLQAEIHERMKLAEELRRLAADLSDSNKRKTEFLAILAHELRNPLAPLRSGIDILRIAESEPQTAQEVLDAMDRQTSHLVRLIDDLLDVSRINQGKLQLRMQPTSLPESIGAAVEAARPLIEASRQLTVDPGPPGIQVHADPTRLTQIFVNLLSNAAKYTDDGGRILVDVQAGDDVVTVNVTDNGHGVPTDQQLHIFDMFTQVDQSTGKSQGGLGIGLTLVKRLTEMHGGRVKLVSEGPGRGSTFSITLPRLVGGADPLPVAARQAGPAALRRRILVVDDNRDAARTLRLILERWGHEVDSASNGQEAIDRVRQHPPEIVFMDIGMPVLNGYEAARLIRADPKTASIVLVAISGWGQDQDRQRAREAGFDHHLVKPGSADDLQRIIASVSPVAPPLP